MNSEHARTASTPLKYIHYDGCKITEYLVDYYSRRGISRGYPGNMKDRRVLF